VTEDFHIVYIILTVSSVTAVMVFFIVFSVIQYQRARRHHENELEAILVKNQKEMLTVKLEIKEQTLGAISEELHDNVGQILSLAKLNVYQIKGTDGEQNIKESISLLDKAISSIRGISHLISNNNIEDKHITDLLSTEVEQLEQSGAFESGLKILTDNEILIEPEKAFIIYRMVQESINNAIKHSKANKIDIFVSEVDNLFCISVEDDGNGFDVRSKVSRSNGLQNLSKRAEVIAGYLEIESAVGKGTKVKIFFDNDYDE